MTVFDLMDRHFSKQKGDGQMEGPGVKSTCKVQSDVIDYCKKLKHKSANASVGLLLTAELSSNDTVMQTKSQPFARKAETCWADVQNFLGR